MNNSKSPNHNDKQFVFVTLWGDVESLNIICIIIYLFYRVGIKSNTEPAFKRWTLQENDDNITNHLHNDINNNLFYIYFLKDGINWKNNDNILLWSHLHK